MVSLTAAYTISTATVQQPMHEQSIRRVRIADGIEAAVPVLRGRVGLGRPAGRRAAAAGRGAPHRSQRIVSQA
jgi:hypothetical protein